MTDELASIRRVRDQAKNELGEDGYRTLTDECRDGIEALVGDDELALASVAETYNTLIEDVEIEGICLFSSAIIDRYNEVFGDRTDADSADAIPIPNKERIGNEGWLNPRPPSSRAWPKNFTTLGDATAKLSSIGTN